MSRLEMPAVYRAFAIVLPVWLGQGLIYLLAGCAGLSPPTGEISRAGAAVSEAIAASRGGQAAAELARAQQKLALTGRFMDAKDYRPARWLAEQAEVDAELALARSASEQALLALAARERARDIQRVTWWRP